MTRWAGLSRRSGIRWHLPETDSGCPRAAWRYEYDERGNLQVMTSAAPQRTVYGYDRHGRGADNRRVGGDKYLQGEDGSYVPHGLFWLADAWFLAMNARGWKG